MDKKYVRLKDLINKEFTVLKVWGYKWKMWIPEENRMHVSDTYAEGHTKRWAVETNAGELELSESQFGQMLVSIFKGEEAKIVGRSFAVKSNGQEGKDIRYYINAVREAEKPPAPAQPEQETIIEELPDKVNLDDIPF